MHTHITYGLALMLAFGVGTGIVGFNIGYGLSWWKIRRHYADREEMKVLARLAEISQGGPQLAA